MTGKLSCPVTDLVEFLPVKVLVLNCYYFKYISKLMVSKLMNFIRICYNFFLIRICAGDRGSKSNSCKCDQSWK